MEMDSPDGKWNTYAEEKALAQARGFDEREGVNVLVYEASHDYLKDMQTQQKRKCYPSMADSSQEFARLVVPASPYIKSSLKSFSELAKSQTSRSRKSAERQRFARMDPEPAGGRKPIPFRQL